MLLVTDATVHKILFENTSGGVTAIGVLASVQGETKKFSAGKEVIIAAGAFNTPKLLELSGAGDETLLEKQRVSVVINNPNVGEHMQNHLMTGVSFEVVDGITTGDPLLRQDPKALEFVQKLYNEEKAGPFTIGGIQSHAFMPVLEFSDEKARERQAELLTSLLENPPNPKDNEYLEIVRSIIESPAEWSSGWFIFLAQANLHEAGQSFVGLSIFPHQTLMMHPKLIHDSSRILLILRSLHVISNRSRHFVRPKDFQLSSSLAASEFTQMPLIFILLKEPRSTPWILLRPLITRVVLLQCYQKKREVLCMRN